MSNQYISVIAGLWAQRDGEVQNATVTVDQLAALDHEIDQRLAALSKSGLVNWSDCDDCLNPDQPGSVFTAAVVAFKDGDPDRIGKSRYLAGSAISAGYCKRLLRNDHQRIRHAASLELALSHVDTAYFNTRARAKWQRKRLYKI